MQSTYLSNEHPWQIGPSASRVLRWIFGFGFFSLHLGIYLLGGLTLLMINLYRSPDDLWVGGPLVRWGVVVFIHLLGAIVCWAATTVVDVARVTKREFNTRGQMSPAGVTVPSFTNTMEVAQPAIQARSPRFSPSVSTPVDGSDLDEEPRSLSRGRKTDGPAAPRPRTSPPGWTVIGAEQRAPATSESEPLAGDIGSSPADSRWTWVEAAAEAWLSDRLEKPAVNADQQNDGITLFEESEPEKS